MSAGEQRLIDRMRERVPCADGLRGPGDDAAWLADPPRGRRVITTDALVEGVHFLRAHPAAWLGWKALAVNLSDVAAMGARPEGFLVTAALPEDAPLPWWDELATGMGALASETGVRLAGGDVVRSPGPVMLSVTAWGCTDGPALLTRAGGAPGDIVMVRGSLGRAAVGLQRWLDADRSGWPGGEPPADTCVRAHLRPEPPLATGPLALSSGATAGMDLSDGLAEDLPRLAAASGVALRVDLERLPADPELASVPVDVRVAGGEDYGLVVLAPRSATDRLREHGLHPIGEAAAGEPGVTWLRGGAPIEVRARPFEHFEDPL